MKVKLAQLSAISWPASGRRPDDSDEEGDHGEDGDLDEDLASGGGSEEGEAPEAARLEVAGHAAEAVVVAALDPPDARSTMKRAR